MSAKRQQSTIEPSDDEYEIRPYELQDRGDVLSLYRTVWDTECGHDWFDWKYLENPYLDWPPMIVASTGEKVVGARPFYSLPLATGTTALTGVYCCDVMVHPDHRRQGLFSRMCDRATTVNVGGDFLFTFGNDQSASGFRKLGWEDVGTGPRRHFRIQRPHAILDDYLDSRLNVLAEPLLTGLARAGLRCTAIRRPPPDESLTIERRDGLPGQQLTTLYEQRLPQELHTRREPRLYRWLSDNPRWQYETYLASREGSAVAALVLRYRSKQDETAIQIVDALPPVSPAHESPIATLLSELVDDYRDRAFIAVKGPVIHEQVFTPDLLSSFGFRATTSPPLSWVAANRNTMFVHPFGTDDLTVDGVDLTDADNWLIPVRS